MSNSNDSSSNFWGGCIIGVALIIFLFFMIAPLVVKSNENYINEHKITMYSSQTQCILSEKTKCNRLLVHIYVKENENE